VHSDASLLEADHSSIGFRKICTARNFRIINFFVILNENTDSRVLLQLRVLLAAQRSLLWHDLIWFFNS